MQFKDAAATPQPVDIGYGPFFGARRPWWITGAVDIHWPAMLLLVFSLHLALLAQLGLSRVREFDADQTAAPEGLARALGKIERASRAWQAWLLPGWGNPEPSWLRTHPATDERIRRLNALSHHAAETLWQDGGASSPGTPPCAARRAGIRAGSGTDNARRPCAASLNNPVAFFLLNNNK
ncbi:MAG: M48 family metalloprotease [Thiobacillus sp.]